MTTVSTKKIKSSPERLEQQRMWHKQHPEYMINYRIKNCDAIRVKNRDYYLKNKEAILKGFARENTCECGAKTRINNYPRHKKSKKHLKYLKQQTSSEKNELPQGQSSSPTKSSVKVSPPS